MPNDPLGPRPGGTASDLNVTAGAHVIKASPGTLYRVSIITASACVSACYDAVTVGNTTLGVTAANLFCCIPANTTGVLDLEWPCQNGLTIVAGTSGVMSISYQ